MTDAQGRPIGAVTSGSFAPSLETAVAMAYVEPQASASGSRVAAAAGRTAIEGELVDMPFYRDGTARRAQD